MHIVYLFAAVDACNNNQKMLLFKYFFFFFFQKVTKHLLHFVVFVYFSILEMSNIKLWALDCCHFSNL